MPYSNCRLSRTRTRRASFNVYPPRRLRPPSTQYHPLTRMCYMTSPSSNVVLVVPSYHLGMHGCDQFPMVSWGLKGKKYNDDKDITDDFWPRFFCSFLDVYSLPCVSRGVHVFLRLHVYPPVVHFACWSLHCLFDVSLLGGQRLHPLQRYRNSLRRGPDCQESLCVLRES